mmetsp:Transcript_20263/g.68977  ORF Transcript_20263/g.68977 Transcript_20263/m.68977 type:complete len:200 (+) Transcript_20263:635-1234(+)
MCMALRISSAPAEPQTGALEASRYRRGTRSAASLPWHVPPLSLSCFATAVPTRLTSAAASRSDAPPPRKAHSHATTAWVYSEPMKCGWRPHRLSRSKGASTDSTAACSSSAPVGRPPSRGASSPARSMAWKRRRTPAASRAQGLLASAASASLARKPASSSTSPTTLRTAPGAPSCSISKSSQLSMRPASSLWSPAPEW